MGRTMAALYPIIIFLHGLNRWVVLAAALWLLAMSILPAGRQAPTTSPIRVPYHVYLSALRLQFLLGVALLFISPLAQAAWSDFGAAMANKGLRFFIVEHTSMMFVAIGMAEAGMAKVSRANDGRTAARAALIFVTMSLLVMLAAIPWPGRELIGRPLVRSW
ncbi:MAG TPA: hypothetical protein VMF13_10755 [Luteitalea sp.]|nr:hypothetical protein [Luteitalea sp.]